VVLYQEPGGGTVPEVHRGEVEEEGELDVGPLVNNLKATDHRAGA